jgi:hypothetical protein
VRAASWTLVVRIQGLQRGCILDILTSANVYNCFVTIETSNDSEYCSVEQVGARSALHVFCRAALTPNRALRIPHLLGLCLVEHKHSCLVHAKIFVLRKGVRHSDFEGGLLLPGPYTSLY